MVLIIGEGLKQHLQVNKQGEGNEKTYSYISDSSVNKQKKLKKRFITKEVRTLFWLTFGGNANTFHFIRKLRITTKLRSVFDTLMGLELKG